MKDIVFLAQEEEPPSSSYPKVTFSFPAPAVAESALATLPEVSASLALAPIQKTNGRNCHTVKPVRRISGMRISRQSRLFRRRFYPEATDADWNDWRWQLRNRIKDLQQLSRIIQLS